jgi:2-polyprenyl-3-methyl-5-hydroxy-6-metoxy-1,4-benzoquinol methylase
VCAQQSPVAVLRVGGAAYYRCGTCGHVNLDASYTPAQLRAMYATYGTRRGEPGVRTHYFAAVGDEVRRRMRRDLRTASRFLPGRGDLPRLLDVGCGTGELLRCARQLGFAAEGVELSPALAAQVEAEVGCRVQCGFLTEVDLPSQRFDVVTLLDLLEHVEEPLEVLVRARELLRPGGVLLLLTPNEHALVREVARLLHRLSGGRLDRPMRLLYYPEHVSYFTRQSLLRLVAAAGLELLRHRTRNQELSRLQLGPAERWQTRGLFLLAHLLPGARGKHTLWARRPG